MASDEIKTNDEWQKYCSLCPNVKFTSKANADQHEKSERHKKREFGDKQRRTAKVNVNKLEWDDEKESEVAQYFEDHECGRPEIKHHKYRDGQGFLLITFTSLEILNKAVERNPHRVIEKRMQLKPLQLTPPKSNDNEASSIEDVKSDLRRSRSLRYQLETLYEHLALPDDKKNSRSKFMCETLIAELEGDDNLKGYKAELFGSSVNCLGTKYSDVDAVFTRNDNEKPTKPKEPRELVICLRNLLHKRHNKLKVCNIVAIPNARIPVVKFTHAVEGYNCDISFSTRASVINSRLIRRLMERSRAAKNLIFAVRLWAKQQNFVGSGTIKINSYTITLMSIFYLQQIGVLPQLKPVIHKLRSENDDEAKQALSGILKDVPDATMLEDFMEFYLRYSFSKNVISTLEGKSLSKDFNLFTMAELNVQDPLEESFNTGKNVHRKIIIYFRRCLVTALTSPYLVQPSQTEPWGLELLLTPGDTVDVDVKNLKTISLTVPDIPDICDRKERAYSRTRLFICEKLLRDLYSMELTPVDEHHPIPTEAGISSVANSNGTGNDDGSPESKRFKTAGNHEPMDLDHQGAKDQSANTMSYLPYDWNVKSKYHVFKVEQNSDYRSYKSWIQTIKDDAIRSSREDYCVEFRLRIEPEDCNFETMRLSFIKCRGRMFEPMLAHFKAWIPKAVQCEKDQIQGLFMK